MRKRIALFSDGTGNSSAKAVFWRQCLYVVTVTLTAVLVLYPWLGGIFANSLHALLRSTRIGVDLDDRSQLLVTQVNESSRGPSNP